MNDTDLERAAVEKAKCSFVLTNKFCDQPNEADASTILQVHIYCYIGYFHSSASHC